MSVVTSSEKYRSLIEGLCERFALGDPATMVDSSANIAMDGTNFTLMYRQALCADAMLMYADFGLLPVQSREAVMLRLLESNLFMSGGAFNPTFGLNQTTGAVILMASIPLAEATVDSVVDAMAAFAVSSAQWEENYLLSEEEFRTGKLSSGQRPAGDPRNRLARHL